MCLEANKSQVTSGRIRVTDMEKKKNLFQNNMCRTMCTKDHVATASRSSFCWRL